MRELGRIAAEIKLRGCFAAAYLSRRRRLGSSLANFRSTSPLLQPPPPPPLTSDPSPVTSQNQNVAMHHDGNQALAHNRKLPSSLLQAAHPPSALCPDTPDHPRLRLALGCLLHLRSVHRPLPRLDPAAPGHPPRLPLLRHRHRADDCGHVLHPRLRPGL
jgi:hypothetical protein